MMTAAGEGCNGTPMQVAVGHGRCSWCGREARHDSSGIVVCSNGGCRSESSLQAVGRGCSRQTGDGAREASTMLSVEKVC